jgi:hypothetical protein
VDHRILKLETSIYGAGGVTMAAAAGVMLRAAGFRMPG